MRPAEGAAEVARIVTVFVQTTVPQEIAVRTPRAANELRNKSLTVLAGPSPSAPGSPPGVRTGRLRLSGTPFSGAAVCGIEFDVNYAGYLETGTSRMAARPFADKIVEESMPKIESIFNEIGG